MNGITIPNNRGMVTLARKLGFDVDIQLEDGIVGLSRPLAQAAQSRVKVMEMLATLVATVLSLLVYVICMV